MKILFVNDFMRYSGAEIVVQTLRRNLEALGHQTYLASCHGPSDFALRSGTLRGWLNPSAGNSNRSFQRILRKVDPDLVHFHNIREVGLGAMQAAVETDVACMYTLHDYLPHCPQRTMLKNGINCVHFEDCFRCFYGNVEQWGIGTVASSPLHPALNRILLKSQRKTILQIVNHVQKVVPSKLMQMRLEKFGMKRLMVIPPGLDLEQPAATKRKLREDLGLPMDALLVGYYGRFAIEKGIELLAQVWKIVDESSHSAYLVTTKQGGRFSLIGEQMGRVIGLTELDEERFANLLASTDIVVAPSIWEEPFNLSVTAAFAMGKPVVATAAGGHLEQIDHEVNGFLSNNDPDEFAGYVSRLLLDRELRLKMGEQARKTYVERFTGRVCTESYLEAYSSLAR